MFTWAFEILFEMTEIFIGPSPKFQDYFHPSFKSSNEE
jgi:hypothetical protein